MTSEVDMSIKTDEFLSNINRREPDGLDGNGQPYRVLVVDDSTVMRKIVSQILKSEMYDVVGEAPNGQKAVDMYNEFKPDLVTMDINMPVKDGISALKEILAVDTSARIVMLTSESEQKMVVDAIHNGAKSYVIKPPERTALLSKVKQSLAS